LYLGANFKGSVGPNKEIIGTLLNESMCMIPLSIVMTKSILVPRHVTKAGELRDVSCSGNRADGIELLILFLSS